MVPSSLLQHAVRSLYDEALALAHLAREQTMAPRSTAAADNDHPEPLPHVDAMPAVTELIGLIGELMNLMARWESTPRHGSAPAAKREADASRPTAPATYPPRSLGTRVAELQGRYQRLLRAIQHHDRLVPSPTTPEPSAPAAVRAVREPGAARRALVIDDDEVYRLFVRRALEEQGWTVDDAHNGQMGWQMFLLVDYELVITDLIMPLQDGFETIPLMRAHRPDTRIVAISGGGQLHANYLAAAALHFGADRTLSKPFSPANLLAAVALG